MNLCKKIEKQLEEQEQKAFDIMCETGSDQCFIALQDQIDAYRRDITTGVLDSHIEEYYNEGYDEEYYNEEYYNEGYDEEEYDDEYYDEEYYDEEYEEEYDDEYEEEYDDEY